MTFYVEVEKEEENAPDYRELLKNVALCVLEKEKCPYEAQVSLLITDNEGIREINASQRGIDEPTDVLSFPVFEYPAPACFEALEKLEGWQETEVFDPESGELMLGDIVISIERAISQAEGCGHSLYREIAFLIAHSMLHLIGYDHMSYEDEAVMFPKQEEVLSFLGIER